MTSIKVTPGKLQGELRIPPSKSYTHRAVILASIADGTSIIKNPLLGRDTMASIRACQALGVKIKVGENTVEIQGPGPNTAPSDIINVENSGTTLRFMTAISALSPNGHTVLTGDSSIRKRPMQPLLDALAQVGVTCWSTQLTGTAPIVISGGGIRGGVANIDGSISSQFASSLIVSCLRARSKTEVHLIGDTVSRPYVDATLEITKRFGGTVDSRQAETFTIPANQTISPTNIEIPADLSSAALLSACTVMTDSQVTFRGIDFTLPQADMQIIEMLKCLGAQIKFDAAKAKLVVTNDGDLNGGTFDLHDCPDLTPVIAVLALRSTRVTRISRIEHTRFKETDRISILAQELPKTGAKVTEYPDGLKIQPPSSIQPCELDAHDDHRLFMAFCAAAMAASAPCIIHGLETIDVSYPSFINDLTSIGATFEVMDK
uniref:3-phosphoshikimate 1-carboxyvinyltransferase n=1 Tax=uncultured marine thaumarchaeote KM3_72_A09 TaxID=1456261 RepID=A0A075HL39_9ARCH|nr:3-phosphoshikimate 1-carboxyvinyltransferase (aroA) [uncultured marine thaumarchaeote KM3_72_A09]